MTTTFVRRTKLRAWWLSLTEMQRDHLKLLIVVGITTVLGAGIFWVARPSVRAWQRKQALTQATEFAAGQDYRSALLALQRAIAKDPNDLATWQLIADFLSQLGSPEALVARRNAMILAPDDLSVRLGFVVDALRFGEAAAAREVFDAVRDGAREEVTFFRMAAALAYATGDLPRLEENLRRIVTELPQDHEARFDLAALQLWAADATKAAAAEQELRGLLAVPQIRVRAAIELLKYSAQGGNPQPARARVAELCRVFTGADPLQPADGSAAVTPPGWTQVLEGLRREAASTATDAVLVARWLGAVGQPREALVWLETLAPEVWNDRLTRSAATELALRLNDGTRLRRLLVEGAWGDVRTETIDLAFAAHWQKQTARTANGQATWNDAVTSASDALSGLRVLARLAYAWGDREGGENALFTLVDRFPNERWAWEALRVELARQRDARKLWQLYERWSRFAPADLTVAADGLMLSVLAGQGNSATQARARDLFRAHPERLPVRLAYVATQRLAGRRTEALAALEQVTPEEAAGNRVRLWRGIVLADLQRRAEAAQALRAVDRERLLSEEDDLWQRAAVQAGIFQPPPPSASKAKAPADARTRVNRAAPSGP